MILKELMKERRLTQNDLADILNVSRASIYKYQQGKAEPNIETLIKIFGGGKLWIKNLVKTFMTDCKKLLR